MHIYISDALRLKSIYIPGACQEISRMVAIFFPFIVFSVLDRASELNENMLFVLKILVLLPKFPSKDYYFAFQILLEGSSPT